MLQTPASRAAGHQQADHQQPSGTKLSNSLQHKPLFSKVRVWYEAQGGLFLSAQQFESSIPVAMEIQGTVDLITVEV